MPARKPPDTPPAATRDVPAPAREMAPAVPLIVDATRGTIRGVDLQGSGPNGQFTAEDTAARLSRVQYRTGLRIGLLRPVPDTAPAPAPEGGNT